jgi:hypothetical protein
MKKHKHISPILGRYSNPLTSEYETLLAAPQQRSQIIAVTSIYLVHGFSEGYILSALNASHEATQTR